MVCEFAGPRWWQCAEGGGWLSGWLVSASYQQPAGDGIKPTSVTLEQGLKGYRSPAFALKEFKVLPNGKKFCRITKLKVQNQMVYDTSHLPTLSNRWEKTKELRHSSLRASPETWRQQSRHDLNQRVSWLFRRFVRDEVQACNCFLKTLGKAILPRACPLWVPLPISCLLIIPALSYGHFCYAKG